jgi:hypothetical protein
MSQLMSDHQDTNHFSYERSWEEIEAMLDKAERMLNYHKSEFYKYQERKDAKGKKKTMLHARNYKALEGVCKTLRWTLGDKNVKHPLQ